MKHGILSRLTVLPHEDHEEFDALLTSLVQEHQPKGTTEMHLIEELAGIMWRKRRLLLAEGATINQGLRSTGSSPESIISAAVPFRSRVSPGAVSLRELMELTPQEAAERHQDALQDLEATRKAMTILEKNSADAYQKALKTLLPDSQDWWQEFVEEEEYPASAEGLAEFIERHLEPLCMAIESALENHAAIKSQALGEGMQIYRLEKLNRYETHLDRKFERTLAMLIKLKELRNSRD